ncbi:AlpA family transcriptional regulator [Pseudomonas sp. SIMBA_077]
MTHQTCKSATSPQAPFSVPVDINAKRTCHPAADPAAILIRMPEVMGIVGLARPTIYKLLQQADSDFPHPVKLSGSSARGAPVAWVLAEVLAWTRARIAARDKAAA